MRVTERNAGHTERDILADMMTDPVVLATVSDHWESEGLFGSSYANTIAGWCINHFRKNHRPPGRNIEGYLERWCLRQRDEHLIELIRNVFHAVNDQLDAECSDDPTHTLDVASRHFTVVKMRKMNEKVTSCLALDDLEGAEKAKAECNPIVMKPKEWTNLFGDENEFIETFSSDEEEALFDYGGDLQQFLGNTFAKGEFVSFLAGPKVGKSMVLADIAWRAMCERNEVAYFEVGDLGKRRTKKRFITRALRHPWRSTSRDGTWPCRLRIPKNIRVTKEKGKLPFSESDFDEKVFHSHLIGKDAWTKCREIIEQKTKSKRPFMRLSSHAANSISVAGIRLVLRSWEREGFVPSCVIIDYADILARQPGTGKMDTRDQINQTWIELRRMSQELHCLVVTATQSDAEGYDRWLLEKKNFNGDRRKNDHVTAMLGINQTAEEKDRGQCRWNFIDRREAAYNPRQCLFLASCMAIGQPAMLSSF